MPYIHSHGNKLSELSWAFSPPDLIHQICSRVRVFSYPQTICLLHNFAKWRRKKLSLSFHTILLPRNHDISCLVYNIPKSVWKIFSLGFPQQSINFTTTNSVNKGISTRFSACLVVYCCSSQKERIAFMCGCVSLLLPLRNFSVVYYPHSFCILPGIKHKT